MAKLSDVSLYTYIHSTIVPELSWITTTVPDIGECHTVTRNRCNIPIRVARGISGAVQKTRLCQAAFRKVPWDSLL